MVYTVLHTVLHKLGPQHLHVFKRHVEKHQQIPPFHLRPASVHNTARLMIEHHGHEGALTITLRALKEMNKRQLIRHLKELVREGVEDIADHVLKKITEDDDDDGEEDDEGDGEDDDDE